jgi:hypothetical protein
LKRIIMIGTAIAVLVGAAAAYAALNTYTATVKFQSSGAGTAKAPKPIGYTETLAANGGTSGNRAAPLIDIKTTIYGVVADTKAFPTCSFATIDKLPKFDAACPPKAKVGGGSVNSILGFDPLSAKGSPCNPGLDVWNGGGNKLWFFFTAVGDQCGALRTGSTQPYPGFIKQSGKNLVIDVPLPPFVSTKVANTTGLLGSLIKEVLTFPKKTATVKGKTVAFLSSVACKGKTRPYSVSFTATDSGTTETKVVSGKGSC